MMYEYSYFGTLAGLLSFVSSETVCLGVPSESKKRWEGLVSPGMSRCVLGCVVDDSVAHMANNGIS